MPALVAGIHVFLLSLSARKSWMAGSSPAMTKTNAVPKLIERLRPEQRLAKPVLDVRAVTHADRHRIALGGHLDVAEHELAAGEDLRNGLGQLMIRVDGLRAGEAAGRGDAGEADATMGVCRLHAGLAVLLVVEDD